MIYPNTFEKKLQFEKIRTYLYEHCLSNLGKEWVDKMVFSTNFDQVKTLLAQTNEMWQIGNQGEDIPTSYFIDAREFLIKIKVDGLFLEVAELFDIRRSITTIRDIIKFINSKEKDEFPNLHKLTENVIVFPEIINKIDLILDNQGRIKDNASPELKDIRNNIRSLQQSVSRRMDSILRQAIKDGLVEEGTSPSIRDGRAVIPIISSYKRKIDGIIHDESATGKTTYIEPAAIVEINNQIRELNYAERREIVKILTDISNFIRPYINDLLFGYNYLGIIDFIRAKARFAKRINAIMPQINQTPTANWVEAVHPLLFLHHKAIGKEVVPLSIEFDENNRIVIISGPNAGGKSVCLQTVGLIQYMLQCGLLVPMAEGSTIGFFNKIFLDLGDEQSIENDLSTYSSHLLNMKNFLKDADNNSLLLIDEFGTGTEPMLGGAIAESVLEQLNNQGAYGVITTHYTNLKHFASQTAGLVNGAMQFNTHLLQPLFKLEVGSPGSSFAFEIAHKIGLNQQILDNAKEKLGEDHIHFDKHLREIIRDKRYWETKRQSIRGKEKQLENVSSKYEKELAQLSAERKKILDAAKKEAEQIINQANRKIENTIRTIKETQADRERTLKARQELSSFKDAISEEAVYDQEMQDKLQRKIDKINSRQKRKKNQSKKPIEKAPIVVEEPIKVGDMVMIDGQTAAGEVIEIINKNAVIAFGQISSTTPLKRLTKVSKNKIKRTFQRQPTQMREFSERIRKKKLNFKSEIDVRGMRADEAMDEVTTLLDEAVMCDASQVRILHGKGTGALRQIIREYLNTLPFVESYEDEDVRFGGAGITVIKLE